MGKSFQDLPPHLLYKILTQGSLSALDLVHVEATCYAFRAPPGLLPLRFKSIVEIAAVDLCEAHPLYSLLPPHHRKQLLCRCGCNWKMLLRYLQSTEQANGLALTPKGKVQVAAGKYHSLVLACDKGGVFACGSDLPFVCPDDTVRYETSGSFTHVRIPQNVLVIQVASSHQHVAFITSGGELYTYGNNKSGCCGIGETNQSGAYIEEANQTVTEPRLVINLKGTRCKQASAGANFTMVLTMEGHVYTCGKNTHGQLGHGDTIKRHAFTKIETLDRVVQMSAGASHALAVTQGGAAFSWGYGGYRCLGHQDFANEAQPRLIQKFKDDNLFLIGVSAGDEHSVALDSKGQVYTWGRGYCGALGHGDEADVQIPQRVATLTEVRAVQVCTSKRRTFVLSDCGRLYGFGWMGFGSLGLTNRCNSDKVLIPSVLDSLKDHYISQVSAGLYHTLVVTNKGTILGFGDNDKGPLGIIREAGSDPEPFEVVNLDLLQTSSPFEHAVASVLL